MAQTVVGSDTFDWSDIAETTINLEKLRLLCHHEKALRREGYVTSSLTKRQLLAKLRCQNCQKRIGLPKPNVPPTPEQPKPESTDDDSEQNPAQIDSKRKVCVFHPGRVVQLHWQCCQAHVSVQKGCQESTTHTIHHDHQNILALEWTYHSVSVTVPRAPVSSSHGKHRKKARFTNNTINVPRSAIALDCEFGVSVSNEPVLIRLTAIDFFTKEVLLDSLVKPLVYIKNYNTRYSGVTATDMRNAVQRGNCIFGRDEARAKLTKFMDLETILIMHGGSSDLSSLRLIHPHIIDTFILDTYFEKLEGGRNLKNLCEKKIGIKIQSGRGHDSLEDAFACRELAYWTMKLIPDW